jgi:ankyrin repeat protein
MRIGGSMLRQLGALSLAFVVSASSRPDSPVADAAMRGDAEAVRALLKQGADVNAPQGDGSTALHWAAETNNVEIVRLLLDASANVDATTRNGALTPLHVGAEAGSAAVVELLLQAGADANIKSTRDVTALHLAAAAGSVETVQALMEHGADVNARESAAGQTPLLFAAENNRAGVIKALLAGGADPSLATKTLDVVARVDEDAEIRARQAAAGKTNAYKRNKFADQVGVTGGMTPLHHATRQGHVEAALALLEGGADINEKSADGSTPMLIATINGHWDLALQLLQTGADPNLASAAGATPLYATISLQWAPQSWWPQPTAQKQQKVGYMELMETFLKAGADPNARLTKDLWYSELGTYYLVNQVGATPFWRAAYGADVNAMKMLVAYGADPTIPTSKSADDNYGGDPFKDLPKPDLGPEVEVGGPAVYPLHAATGAGYGLGHGGNVHRHVPDGWLPTVKYLVEELGANVNQRDNHGFTPLHNAASMGNNELIQYLVSKGADPLAVSRYGQTTVDMANGPYWNIPPYPATIALLESMGAVNHNHCYGC